jgi:hypothetical protein
VLPLAEAQRSDQYDERAARADLVLEPRLPGLARVQAVAIEEGAEARFRQTRS